MDLKLTQIVRVDPVKLKSHPRNPNKHPQEQIELLMTMIKGTGFRTPIIVSKRSNCIVSGHGRVEAAMKLGMHEVPVSYQDFESEAEELAFLVADNAIQDLANLERKEIMDIVEDIDDGSFDLAMLGITEEKLEMLMTSAADIPDECIPSISDPEMQCPKCGFKFEK